MLYKYILHTGFFHGNHGYPLVTGIDEEMLWNWLLQWSAFVQQPELLGPLAEAAGACVKRAKTGCSKPDSGAHWRSKKTSCI
jgi:hypothetical protein